MSKLREAAQAALDAWGWYGIANVVQMETAIQVLRNALAEPEPTQEQQVGCEGTDGLLRVHNEREVCDVCGPLKKKYNEELLQLQHLTKEK
jgi:hypothetical protein